MIKLLFKAKKHYKQNIHLIAIPKNSYDEIILELSHIHDYKNL